jgi:sn-glycerol 3-phosphate transport system permease protein
MINDDFGQATAWFNRGVSVFVIGFTLAFVVSEWAGLMVLMGWLGDVLAQTPAWFVQMAEYYVMVPMAQWLPSVGIGAIVGGGLSHLRLRSRGGVVIGALIGAISGQVLTRVLQHCTYALGASRVEWWLGVAVTGLSALLLLFPLWAVMQRGSRLAGTSGYFRARVLPYLLLGPMVLNLLLFLYYPSLQTLILSLNVRRFPLPQEEFVCLGNYTALATDATYGNSLFVSGLLTVFIVAASLGLALGIALLASQPITGAAIYRTLLVWPFALSPVVAGAIFLVMFREGQTGLINAVLHTLTGTTLNWQRDPALAQVSVALAAIWNVLGFNILFYIAGLQNVPADLLEAAQIDGANRGQRFFKITLPLLGPYTFFLLVTNITYAFYGIYGVVDTLTQGGPPLGAAGQDGGATDVLIYKLYEDAFNPGSPAGLAAAQAVFLFVMLAGITLLQFRVIDTRINYQG